MFASLSSGSNFFVEIASEISCDAQWQTGNRKNPHIQEYGALSATVKTRRTVEFSGLHPFVKNAVARLLLLPLQTSIIPVNRARGRQNCYLSMKPATIGGR